MFKWHEVEPWRRLSAAFEVVIAASVSPGVEGVRNNLPTTRADENFSGVRRHGGRRGPVGEEECGHGSEEGGQLDPLCPGETGNPHISFRPSQTFSTRFPLKYNYFVPETQYNINVQPKTDAPSTSHRLSEVLEAGSGKSSITSQCCTKNWEPVNNKIQRALSTPSLQKYFLSHSSPLSKRQQLPSVLMQP